MYSQIDKLDSLVRMLTGNVPSPVNGPAPTVEELRAIVGDVSRRITYPNGYTASLIRHRGSYGSESGLFEIAVVHGGRLVYDTPVTDDVCGNLTPEEVAKTLEAIAQLPVREG